MNAELNDSDRHALVEYRLTRAYETLKEAEYNALGEYYNTAVNRLYYAAYYAVAALMISEGHNATTHSGIKTMLGMHFIRTGKLDIEHGRTFMMLFENRQSGDYEDFVYCDKNLYAQLFPKTVALIDAIKGLIGC